MCNEIMSNGVNAAPLWEHLHQEKGYFYSGHYSLDREWTVIVVNAEANFLQGCRQEELSFCSLRLFMGPSKLFPALHNP